MFFVLWHNKTDQRQEKMAKTTFQIFKRMCKKLQKIFFKLSMSPFFPFGLNTS